MDEIQEELQNIIDLVTACRLASKCNSMAASFILVSSAEKKLKDLINELEEE